MLPWTALLCAAMILKGGSALFTNSSFTTFADGVDNSTAAHTLSLRDDPTTVTDQNGSEDGEKLGIFTSTASIGARDTATPPPDGKTSTGDPYTALEALSFWDRCPINQTGDPTGAQSKGGKISAYIVGTCQAVDAPPPGAVMMVWWQDPKMSKILLYKDKNCTGAGEIFIGVPGKNNNQNGCFHTAKLPQIQAFKGL